MRGNAVLNQVVLQGLW